MKQQKIFQIKVQLKDMRPSIYRTFLVSETDTFNDLHEYIQDAFGFYNYHLWMFYKRDAQMRNLLEIMLYNEEYEAFSDFGIAPAYKFESDVTLSEIFLELGFEKISYEYDFGDSWNFSVELQKILETENAEEYPKLLKSKGGKLIEDCGGVGRYQQYIASYAAKKYNKEIFESWEEFEEYVEPAFEQYSQEDFFCDRQL